MSSSHSRAWRFVFHSLDALDSPAGLAISYKGGIETVDEAASVRQAILLLLSTRPGERVMRPEYGCHLSRLAFAPNDDTTAGLAIHYVQQALARWEPRVRILRLDAVGNEAHPSRLDVHLQYSLRTRPAPEQVSLSVDLQSGLLH